MPIRYSLRDNRLTSDPDDRYAQVESTRTFDLDEVADRIAASGTTVTRVDVVSVLESIQAVVRDLLMEGANVTLPFANYSVGIQGVFTSDEDPFDPARHAVMPRVQAGAALRRAFQGPAPVERVEPTEPAPSLRYYQDHLADERDGALTPGGVGEVVGARLGFDPDVAEEGVFFVAEDGSETRASVVPQVRPSRVLFVVPAGLAAGAYRLEVRSAFGQEVREGRLKAVLTVA